MPLTADHLKNEDKYHAQLKKEINNLPEDGSDFWFFDGVEGQEKPIILLGDFKTSMARDLKGSSKTRAEGRCRMNNKVIEVTIRKGKVTSQSFKPLNKLPFLNLKLVDFELAEDASDEQVSQAVSDADRKWYDDRTAKLRGRFDELSGSFSDDDQRPITAAFLAADLAQKQTGFDAAHAELDKVEPLMATAIKNAKARIKGNKVDAQITEAIEKLETKIAELNTDLAAQEKRRADASGRTSGQKRTRSKANKQIRTIKEALSKTQEKLDQLKADTGGDQAARVRELAKLRGVFDKLDQATNAISMEDASEAIEENIKGQAEASEWQKQRLKDNDDGHGTTRHGAQTGVERQARRAATDRNITPDQPGNEAGTAGTAGGDKGEEVGTAAPNRPKARKFTWNKVEVTFAEGEDGKKVITNRTKTAKEFVRRATRKSGTSDIDETSMWANPMLEKEAYDKAKAIAAKLGQNTDYYSKNKRRWNTLNKLVMTIGAPDKAKGWGVAIKRTGSTITEEKAEELLIQFETGKLSLQKLFSEMHTEMVGRDGGADLIPTATIVMERDNPSSAWKVITHYPDSGSTVGWDIGDGNRSGTRKLRKGARDSGSDVSLSTLP